MKYVYIGFFFFLFLPVFLRAQEVEVKRERTFTGSGLYGYMNGGAEQFLEYGVSKLITRDMSYKGEEFTMDVYDMPSPEEAFGIYSLHVFRCERADASGCLDCLSRYQWQAAVGNRYVSVVFPSGSAKAQRLADELVRLYIPLEGQTSPRIPADLQADVPHSVRLKYLKGPISVSGISSSLSALLKEIPYAGVWFVADKAEPEGYRAWVELKTSADKETLKALLATEEGVQESRILREGETYLYFFAKEKEQSEEEDPEGFGF